MYNEEKELFLSSKMVVYCFTNKINGKQYIGQTIRKLKNRLIQHIHVSKRKTSLLGNAIKKYGISNFTLTILHRGNSIEELNEFEKKYIEKFNTLAPNGYNLRIGGNNETYTDAIKEVFRASHRTESYLTKVQQLWNDPIHREKHQRGLIEANKNPKELKRKSDHMKQRMSDPKYKRYMYERTCVEFDNHGNMDVDLLKNIEDMLFGGMSMRKISIQLNEMEIKTYKNQSITPAIVRNLVIRHNLNSKG